MKIFLIRHGEADSSLEGIPLTEKGIKEAKSVAKELSKYNIQKVYSSDLKRSRDTAWFFSKNKKTTLSEDIRLREVYRTLVGGPEREGTPKDRAKKDSERADGFFNEILKNNEDVAVFCHGNIIRYFLNKVLKSKSNIWDSLTINNCSISLMEYNESTLQIKMINSISHLPKEELKEILNINKKENYLD